MATVPGRDIDATLEARQSRRRRAGMHLARTEMEVLLEALVEARVTLSAGEPVRGTNRGLFGFTELPFEIKPTNP
jgi:cytochrome P450